MSLKDGFSFYTYTDFRQLLKEYVSARKAQNKVFSYRWYSQKAGYSSPNFLKLVIDGQRSLTDDGVERLAKVFTWTAAHRKYFQLLVNFDRCKSQSEKSSLALEIAQSQASQQTSALNKDQMSYYTHWYYIPIRELILSQPSPLTSTDIGNRLCPRVSAKNVDEAIGSMLRLKIIKKTKTWYKVANDLVDTGNETTALVVGQYHRQNLEMAKESMDRFPPDIREISSSTLNLCPDSIEQAKTMVQEFRKKLFALEKQSGSKEVYQFNFQMFPLTQSRGKK